MSEGTITVLLVSKHEADAGLIRRLLAGPAVNGWRLEHVARLSDGISRLAKGGIAAILLDPHLPDSQGIETFEALFAKAPLVPIIILTDPWAGRPRGAAHKKIC
jgi:DNA-binding response OmpR family regulator